MGRPKKNKEANGNGEAKSDRTPETAVGGANPELLKRTIKSCNTIDNALAEARGDKASALERFKDGGGNKKMLKWSMALANTEVDIAKDHLNTLFEYLKFQGIVADFSITFAQGEMFEGADTGNKGGAEPEEEAEDEEGDSEPAGDVGQQQAAAFESAHH